MDGKKYVIDLDFRPIIEIAVANAEIIAVVELSNKAEIYGDSGICGYSYDANTIELLKGNKRNFRFFIKDPPSREDGEFLVFIYKSEKISQEILSFFMMFSDREEATSILCRSENDFFVPVGFSTIWAFDQNLGKEFGGKWLAPSSQPIQWCWGGDGAAPESKDELQYKTVQINGHSKIALHWRSAKDLIVKALDNRPYYQGVRPSFDAPLRPDFRPAVCPGSEAPALQ